MGYSSRVSENCWNCYLWICRILGFLTALGLWGVGAEATFYGHLLGIYILVAAAIVSYLESMFLLNYFVELMISSESVRCLKCWEWNLWVDDWRRGVLYILLSVGCFVQPTTVHLALITGGLLAACGLFYCFKTIRSRAETDTQLPVQKTCTYGRFDELHDDAEDDIINPTSNMPIVSVADQSEILEV